MEEKLPVLFKIKTYDGKEYDICALNGSKVIYYKKQWRIIIGSATNRIHPKEIIYMPEAANLYKFSEEIKKDYFIIFELNNKINEIARIREIIEVSKH
ncbi:MAG: hypothetical protein KJ623_04605 [Nanoarchaeota archaeon]|nr:hypothetical protein [Nanoarchaeota archaeon]MBU0962605.1 hypothetical protein [Nanoarchaeota archaeon]